MGQRKAHSDAADGQLALHVDAYGEETGPEPETGPLFLVLDSETNGLPVNWKLGWKFVDNWPRVVQLAWVLYTADFKELDRKALIVRPDGFDIPEEASRIHGITTERALAEGNEIADVLAEFEKAVRRADWLVAHNASYDGPVIAAEFWRRGENPPFDPAAMLCTKIDGTYVTRIPNDFNTGYKWPKLEELHRFLLGEDFEGAHDAMVDVEACARCFFKRKENNQIPKLRSLTVR